MILVQMSIGCEPSSAAVESSLSKPLLKQGTLPPEEADGIFRYWTRQKKYFLVIAVTQTDAPKTELPFARVDGQRIVEELTRLGYQPLDKRHQLFTGEEATRSAIMASFDEARPKEDEATLIVYYTGHGAVGAKDLWLQTAGQVKVGDGQGISVSDLVGQIRHTATGKGFEGEVVLILDACYSGHGTVSQGLTLRDLGKRTTILTSSADIQESFSLKPPTVQHEVSAFTYAVLQGLGPAWAEADHDGDGLLRWEELKMYAENHLRQLNAQGALAKVMTPELLTNYTEGALAYRRDQVRTWKSVYRPKRTTSEMEQLLAQGLQTVGADPKKPLTVPKEAVLLAEHLEPAPDDYYAQAVKAATTGQLDTSRTLFAKADAQSRERTILPAATQQQEREKQGEIAWARARMENYAGRFTEAFAQYQQAATLAPATNPALLDEIGVAGLRAGKYAEAEPTLTQALQQREQALPPGHTDIAKSLGNLAELYGAQGKYDQAEPLYQRALQINEAALGATHPMVATSLNNLALLYHAQRQYDQAEPLFQRALQIDKVSLGADHPDVATSLGNLAELYGAQGKYDQAEPLYQRALQIDKAALGTDHPHVARDLNDLALLYAAKGQYDQAEPLYQRALQINVAAFGANHPAVAKSLHHLAELYRSQGKYDKAEPLYQQSFWIVISKLGPDHPSVSTVLAAYRASLKASGQPASEGDALEKLRTSSYAPPNASPSP